MTPEIRYANSGDVNIAYQVIGDGPEDLVVIPGWISNLEVYWECPEYVRFHEYLATFCRVILFDKRGTGLSDRVPEMPSLEVRIDDVRAVLDAVGSESASLFGWSEGGPMACLFAATHPERINRLILAGSYARRAWAPDYPWGMTDETFEEVYQDLTNAWGTAVGIEARAFSMARDERFRIWWAKLLRMSASARDAMTLSRMNFSIDISSILPTITVPTLVIHARDDPIMPIEAGRYLVNHIPGARIEEIHHADHVPYTNGADTILEAIETFMTGTHHSAAVDRVLATVMFTDIVGATEQAASMGDSAWRQLISAHHEAVRKELTFFRGREIDTAGDGFFAAFDGPARAIQCARAIVPRLKSLGLEVRVGIHTGECEIVNDKLGGIAVHIGARISALAQAGEVLVSGTVRDLVAGSGLTFDDKGQHELKGIPGQWAVFVVV
ncbi:MAG: adenylate/guanylate cyclase domain-containing protein [Burkholderiaceae bacterium]